MHDYGFRVNQVQSALERKTKYQLLKIFDVSVDEARRMRDWNWSKWWGWLASQFPNDWEAIQEMIQNAYDSFSDERNANEALYRDWKNQVNEEEQ